MTKTAIIIDGSNLMYAMYHGMPDMQTSTGFPTNSIRGVCAKLLDFEVRYPDAQKIFVLDAFSELFSIMDKAEPIPLRENVVSRNTLVDNYKGDRPDVPDGLKRQIKGVASIAKNMGWHVFIAGEPIEADDVIYSFGMLYAQAGYNTIVGTNDKDLIQGMAHPNYHIWRFAEKDAPLIDRNFVINKFGVSPDKIGLYLAIHGDKVDGIPGIKGAGEAKAIELCNLFNNMQEIIDAATLDSHPKVITKKLRERILENQEIYLNYERATVLETLPLDIANLKHAPPVVLNENLDYLFTKFEFKKFKEKVISLSNATSVLSM